MTKIKWPLKTQNLKITFYQNPQQTIKEKTWLNTISASQAKSLFNDKTFFNEILYHKKIAKKTFSPLQLRRMQLGTDAEPQILNFCRDFHSSRNIWLGDFLIIDSTNKISATPDYFNFKIDKKNKAVYLTVTELKYSYLSSDKLNYWYKSQVHHQLILIINWLFNTQELEKEYMNNIFLELGIAVLHSKDQCFFYHKLEYDISLINDICKLTKLFWNVFKQPFDRKETFRFIQNSVRSFTQIDEEKWFELYPFVKRNFSA